MVRSAQNIVLKAQYDFRVSTRFEPIPKHNLFSERWLDERPTIPQDLANDIYSTVQSAQECMLDAYLFLNQNTIDNLPDDQYKRKVKWGAYQFFRCRRPGLNVSPFTDEQYTVLRNKVGQIYQGLMGSNGDLILKLGFGGASSSGISQAAMNVVGLGLDGYVSAHPFYRRQRDGARPTKSKFLGWTCAMGDLHLGEGFTTNCGPGAGDDENVAVNILTHEASHKFAGAKDETYFSWDGLRPTRTIWGGAVEDTRQLLNNADSISMFCMLIAGWLDEDLPPDVQQFDVTT
jgi:hypothetical protein